MTQIVTHNRQKQRKTQNALHVFYMRLHVFYMSFTGPKTPYIKAILYE